MNEAKKLSLKLYDNVKILEDKLKECPDIVWQKKCLQGRVEAYFIYVEGLVDVDLVQRDFVKPLLQIDYECAKSKSIEELIPLFKIAKYKDMDLVLKAILEGETILLIDNIDYALSCSLKKFDKRNIEEPITEKNVKGPSEGFIETIDVNMAMLRRRIKNSNLKFKTLTLGNETKQLVAIAYIEGIANPLILDRLYNKVRQIDIDGLIGISYIEQFISDSPNSIFPQYLSTERVDKSVAALLEGRFAIFLDGIPRTLIAPISIFSILQAPDDYNTNWISGTIMRLIRTAGIITAVILPALYIAITSFQYYLVPLSLLLTLGESRARVPFPPVIEALIMGLTLEMIQEASIRLPTYIGSTIGVIGGIVIGQAAVNAGLVSSLFIIIIAASFIASFTVPVYDLGLALRSLRFAYIIISGVFGIVGIIIANSLLLAHLVSLESLGEPYINPVLLGKLKDSKDTFIRVPIKYLLNRPDIANPLKKSRRKSDE